MQSDEGGQRRKRNRQEHCDRGAHAAEEQQDDHRGEEHADGPLVEQRADGVLDIERLIEDDPGDQVVGGIEEIRYFVLDRVHRRDGIGIAALAQHRLIDRRLAVDTHDVVLNLGRVLGNAHVGHRDRGLPHGLDRRAHDAGHVGELAVGEDGVIERAHAHGARGDDEVGVIDGADHVHRAHGIRFKLLRIDIDHDLAIGAAEGRATCVRTL